MIKEYLYENGNSSIVAEFGNGDLVVGDILDRVNNRSGIAIFNNYTKEPIGTLHSSQKGENISDIAEESIIINFTKVESIDVVIKYLTDAKESLNELLKEV